MPDAFICDAVRTPIGRYGGGLARVRPDDMAALVIRTLMERNTGLDAAAIDDVIFGCANQAGEDNRNVAHMAALLAGLPEQVSGVTVNRLCGSGLDAVGQAARAIRAGDASLIVAGGVESMSRAPFVMGKAEAAFSRAADIHDSTLGWRFVNALMKKQYGIDSMPETGENVAEDFKISRADQDAFAHRSNASGVNDGAAALIVASEEAVKAHGLTPRARVVGMAAAGVAPRIMGIGPAPATEKLLAMTGNAISDIDVIELNEAFASQGLAVMRQLGLDDDAEHVNPNGGAIALGHPLGMSGARLALTATEELHVKGADKAVCTMCIGVGQGIAALLERV
jgi:acetyl-CoA acetyltransferase